MYCLARTDMITIQAMAWNQRKIENLAKVLSRRLMKVYFWIALIFYRWKLFFSV